MLGQLAAGAVKLLRKSLFSRVANQIARSFGLQRNGRAADAFLHRGSHERGVKVAVLFAELAVARKEHGGYAFICSAEAENHKFAGNTAIDANLIGFARKRVRQRVSAARRAAVIADKHNGVKALVYALAHAVRVSGPVADDFCALGQLFGVNVIRRAVCVFNDDFRCARFDGTLARCNDLCGHLRTVIGIACNSGAAVLVSRGGGDTFDVGADKYLHLSILQDTIYFNADGFCATQR